MERPSHVRRLAMNVPQRWWFVMVCCTSPLGFMFWFILMFLWCFFFLLFWSMMFEGVDMANHQCQHWGLCWLVADPCCPLGAAHWETGTASRLVASQNWDSSIRFWPVDLGKHIHCKHLNSSSLHLVPKQVGRTIRSSTSQAWVRFRISTASLWDSMLGIFPSAAVKVGKAFAKLWWCCLPVS